MAPLFFGVAHLMFLFTAAHAKEDLRTVEAVLEESSISSSPVAVAPAVTKPPQKKKAKKTLREALLCKARTRLSSFVDGEQQLSGGGTQDGVELHFAGTVPCNGVDTPLIFANWSLKGVKPVHVFSALTDLKSQSWNSALQKAQVLKDFPSLKAAGVRLEYTAGPGLSNRKVYEWETFDRTNDGKDYWFVASTDHNSALKKLDTAKEDSGSLFSFMEPSAVEADSCLSAHHFWETEDGVQAVFTNTVNGHPPLGISPNLVSRLTWGKSVDFVKGLQKRALELANLDQSELKLPPRHLFSKKDVLVPEDCESMDMLDSAWTKIDEIVEEDELLPGWSGFYEAASASSNNVLPAAALLGVSSLLALAAFRAWSRSKHQDRASEAEAVAFFQRDTKDHLASMDVEAPEPFLQ
jgi:hypothetical protein